MEISVITILDNGQQLAATGITTAVRAHDHVQDRIREYAPDRQRFGGPAPRVRAFTVVASSAVAPHVRVETLDARGVSADSSADVWHAMFVHEGNELVAEVEARRAASRARAGDSK